MRTRSGGAVRGGDFRLPGLSGMGALSERFSVNGPGCEDRSEGTGVAEIGWVNAKALSPPESRAAGTGGGCFTSTTGGITDAFNFDEKESAKGTPAVAPTPPLNRFPKAQNH